MAEKRKIGEQHMKDLKEHTDNVSSRNEQTTFNLLNISDRMKGLYGRIRTRIVKAPDQRVFGDKFISDIVREEMKGTEAERAELIIKFMALFNQGEEVAAKLKDFYYLEITRLSTQFFLTREDHEKIIDINKNIILENIPLPMLKVLYGETVEFLDVENSILNPYISKEEYKKKHPDKKFKGFIKGWIGDRVAAIGTPFRNKHRDLTGGLVVMTEATMNYVSKVAENMADYLQKPLTKKTKRDYGFDDIFRMIKRIAAFNPNQPNASLTVVRLFNMYMHGRAFIGKDGQFNIYTKMTPRLNEDGEYMYFKYSGDVMFDWSDPVPASEFWKSEYPAETHMNFTPIMLNKFKVQAERARKLYDEHFEDGLKIMAQQKKDLLVEFSKFFPPGTDSDTVAKILFTEEGMENLDPAYREDIEFLKENFLQYGIFETFLHQGHIPDPKVGEGPAKRKSDTKVAVKAWMAIFPDHIFMLLWAEEITRLESELNTAIAEGKPKKIADAKAILRYYNKQFDIMVGSPMDSQGGGKMMPRSTALFMKHVTNSFDHSLARTDESIIYDRLRQAASMYARNDLIIKMLRSWRLAKGWKIVQHTILELWKTTMHRPDVEAKGFLGIPYGIKPFTRVINKIGIGKFKLNISEKFVDRLFRTFSNVLTGGKLGGRITAVKNSTAMFQKVMMYNGMVINDTIAVYNEHKDFFDKLIARSGALSYGDFFSKGLVSNLSGDHELDFDNTWRVVQIYMKYYKESSQAQKNKKGKKGGMTEAKAQANLHERLEKPLSHIPSLQNLKKIKKELYSKKLLEMTAKFANRAITLEYKNTKHVDSLPGALIWKVQNMAEFSSTFQLHAAGMPTMGKTESYIRSISFVLGVRKLQEMGHLRNGLDDLTGNQITDAIRFGRMYTEYLDYGLSQQAVGKASRGAIGSFLNRFKFWYQQKFGWDLRVFKYGAESLKDIEHLSTRKMDYRMIGRLMKEIGSHAYRPAKIRTLMATNPHAAALINFVTLIGPLTVLFDVVLMGPVMGKALKAFMPAYKENRAMYSLATGMGSGLITLVISMPWILMSALYHGFDDDDEDNYLFDVIRNTWVGAGGMYLADLFMYLVYYRIMYNSEKIADTRLKLIETMAPLPGGRIKSYLRWKENIANAMKD